jgi:hypothetical protein
MTQRSEQGAQTRKQGARIREQRVRAREELARLKMLTEKCVQNVAVPRSAKIIPEWVPLAGTIFGVTFNIIVGITAIWLAVWSAE